MFFLDGKCNSSRRLPLGYVGAIIDRPDTAPSSFLSFRETQEAREMGIRVFGRSMSAPAFSCPLPAEKRVQKMRTGCFPTFVQPMRIMCSLLSLWPTGGLLPSAMNTFGCTETCKLPWWISPFWKAVDFSSIYSIAVQEIFINNHFLFQRCCLG